jgi:hypothetical protein
MKNRLTRLVKVMYAARPRSTLVRLLGLLPLLAVTMAAGPCGKEPLGSVDGGVSCTYGGKAYRPGGGIPAGDACNTCTCSSDGLLACTHRTCLDGGSDSGDAQDYDGSQNCRDPLTGQVIPCSDAGPISDGGFTCVDPNSGKIISCGDGGVISDAGPTCFDVNGYVIPCGADGGLATCTYLDQTFPVGASFMLDGGGGTCKRCTCELGGHINCVEATCYVDAGTDGAMSCTYGGKVYPLGAPFPAGDGCNTCSCQSGGFALCTAVACQDAGTPADAGVITGVCKPGQDSMCNEDPFVSALRGKCQPDGSCLCNGAGTSGAVSPYTGKCLGPDNLTGNGCEYSKTYPVGATFQCGDSSCTTCMCASPGKVTVLSSTCSDAGAPVCGLDAVYIYGDVGGLRVSQDQVTIAPSPTSPRDQATYVRTRNSVDGAAGISCNPPFPACGDKTALDVSDIMADLQDPVVQKYLTTDLSKTPFLGFDTRPIDGTAFSFMRGDGHGFLVGQACGTSSSASSCFAIPPAIDKLVKDLRALDQQQLLSAVCAALR